MKGAALPEGVDAIDVHRGHAADILDGRQSPILDAADSAAAKMEIATSGAPVKANALRAA